MPVSKYFKGHGKEVMSDMKGRYGEKSGERVFYATVNKNKTKKKRPSLKALES